MSTEFLRHLNGNATGLLLNLIEKFEHEGRSPKIAWYPSAGNDYRGLLYLTEQYARQFPSEAAYPDQPDLFIMTDYIGNLKVERDGFTLYSDKGTSIQLIAQEELPKLDHAWDRGIVHFEKDCGRATINIIRAISEKGQIDVAIPVIYIEAVNETFCARHMLPYYAEITHVIHIRYGGGLGGGGRAAGGWIPGVLGRLGVQVYITDGRDYMQDGDKKALRLYPWLAPALAIPKMTPCRKQAAKYWSDYGDVTWYNVHPFDPNAIRSFNESLRRVKITYTNHSDPTAEGNQTTN